MHIIYEMPRWRWIPIKQGGYFIHIYMHTFDVAIIVLSFRLIDSRLFGVSCHFSCWCLLCQLLGCRFMFFLVHAFCGCRVAFLVHVHVSSSCACILVTPWFHDDMIFWGFRHCWKWNTVALTFFRWASTIGSRSMENNLHSWSLDLRKTNFWQPSFFTNRNLLRISYLFGESIWVVFLKIFTFSWHLGTIQGSCMSFASNRSPQCRRLRVSNQPHWWGYSGTRSATCLGCESRVFCQTSGMRTAWLGLKRRMLLSNMLPPANLTQPCQKVNQLELVNFL